MCIIKGCTLFYNTDYIVSKAFVYMPNGLEVIVCWPSIDAWKYFASDTNMVPEFKQQFLAFLERTWHAWWRREVNDRRQENRETWKYN